MLYDDAIELLNIAIKNSPNIKEAYKERAYSYFELGKIDLAMQDFYSAMGNPPSYTRKSSFPYASVFSYWFEKNDESLEFATGFIEGVLDGNREESLAFLASVRGGLSCIWAFVCAPVDVSKDFLDAAYGMGQFIADASIYDLVEFALPEIIECRESWHSWSHHKKGKKIGFILGKYSIAACYSFTVIKGTAYYTELKRANMMLTLKHCKTATRARMIQESARYASNSSTLANKIRHGAVIPHNPNVAPHVLQKRHNWSQCVSLTGNQTKDFQNVTKFLEEIQILQCSRTLKRSFASGKTYRYEKNLGRYIIEAEFEVNKNNQPLLRDAWVRMASQGK